MLAALIVQHQSQSLVPLILKCYTNMVFIEKLKLNAKVKHLNPTDVHQVSITQCAVIENLAKNA